MKRNLIYLTAALVLGVPAVAMRLYRVRAAFRPSGSRVNQVSRIVCLVGILMVFGGLFILITNPLSLSLPVLSGLLYLGGAISLVSVFFVAYTSAGDGPGAK